MTTIKSRIDTWKEVPTSVLRETLVHLDGKIDERKVKNAADLVRISEIEKEIASRG